MKRILSIFGILTLFLLPITAQSQPEDGSEGDEDAIVRDDDYSYKMNGRGDQFIKIALMPNFPMNFDGQLYVGGAAQLGYYRFLTGWFGLGGELMAGYNPTIGSNVLTFVPITIGAFFQPALGRFEFPITLSTGIGFETCANKKYFPGFVAKGEVGAFFRIVEGWSAGFTGQLLYLPEWYTTTENKESDYGIFTQISVAARYHF